MKAKTILIFSIFTISASALTVIGLYSIFDALEQKEISGISPKVDHFLRGTSITCLIIYIFVFSSLCLSIKSVRYVALFFIACFIAYDIFMIYAAIAMRGIIVDNIRRVFFTENYEKKAIQIQNAGKCCGWQNLTDTIEFFEDCAYTIPCKIALTKFLTKKSVIVVIIFSLTLVFNCFSLYGEYLMVTETYKMQNTYHEIPKDQKVQDLAPNYSI